MEEEILNIIHPLKTKVQYLKELAMAVLAETEYREEIGIFIKNYHEQGIDSIAQVLELQSQEESILHKPEYLPLKMLVKEMEELKHLMDKIEMKFGNR